MTDKNNTTTNDTEKRIDALIAFLDNEPERDNIEPVDYLDNCFEVFGREYLVLTESEADEKVREYIEDSLWAFNTSFLIPHLIAPIPEKHLQKMQGELCESANEIIRPLIKDMNHFVSDAVSSDGRGHFLNTYDGEEHESGEYYIYRIN